MVKALLLIFVFFFSFVKSQTKFNTKSYGKKILSGEINYINGNEEKLFRTLDSLFCKSKNDKVFYFKVANEIQRFSDGALSDHFAGVAKKYYFEYNSEFISNVSKTTSKDINSWLMDIDYSIAASEQDIKSLPKIKKQLDNLVLNCKCDEKTKGLIKKYNDIIYKNTAIEIEN